MITTGDSSPVKFGTDGWRGVIADDFTFANVRMVAAAIASYVHAEKGASGEINSHSIRVDQGICVGYDTRFLSRQFALAVGEVLAASGIPVMLADRFTPTPALSYAVRQRGAAGGVMITSSHNPYQWNGLKYKASYGGAAIPSIIAAIESHLGEAAPARTSPAQVVEADFQTPYVQALAEFVDLEQIAKSGFKFAIDCMYGSGRGVLGSMFAGAGVPYVEIRAAVNPLFGGISPEPIEPYINALEQAVIEHQCHAGLVTDGDADRIGAVDEHGKFVDPHKIFAIILRWLLERKKWPGDVTRAFNTTLMLDRICRKHGRKLYEHGIGFKNVVEFMLEKDILIGGEEAGGIGITRHMPERDGLLMALILANVMAEESSTLGQLVESLQQEYGEHQYGRIDLHIDDPLKSAAIARARGGVPSLAGMNVVRVETLDGIKFFLDNPEAAGKKNAAETWLLLRASGTEPLLRLYAESCSHESVGRVLEAAREFALTALHP